MEYKIGTEIVLQKCKHSWLNGLDAVIVEICKPGASGTLVAESAEGRHIIDERHIKGSGA